MPKSCAKYYKIQNEVNRIMTVTISPGKASIYSWLAYLSHVITTVKDVPKTKNADNNC